MLSAANNALPATSLPATVCSASKNGASVARCRGRGNASSIVALVERATQVGQVEAPRSCESLDEHGRRLGVGEERSHAEDVVAPHPIEPGGAPGTAVSGSSGSARSWFAHSL